jgi:hypothetical protein
VDAAQLLLVDEGGAVIAHCRLLSS